MGHDLVLYKYDACPFCRRVMDWLDGRDIPVVLRDTREDPEAANELLERTGRTQVPCLFIDSEPLFESRDILDWFQQHCGEEPVQVPSAGASQGSPSMARPSRRARILARFWRG